MGDSAVARILDRGDEDRLTSQDAARVILVDTALQLSAEVTAREESYGGPVRDGRLPIDRMLADLDRTDGMEGGSYHSKEVNDRIAEGRFDAIPDMGVQFALSDGLREARKPFSRPVENQLAIRLAVLKGERDRASDIALGTPSSPWAVRFTRRRDSSKRSRIKPVSCSSTAPAGVSLGERRSRSINCVPSSRSISCTARLSAGCAMRRRRAAREKLSSSATA